MRLGGTPKRAAGLLLVLVAASALAACAAKREAEQRCVGHLERVSDARSIQDLLALPETAKPVELSRTTRDPGCMAMNAIAEITYQLGDYRVDASVDSDRGRPGPARVQIARPDLCEGGAFTYDYGSTSNSILPLHHDAALGADVVILPAYPEPIGLVLRLVPGPRPRAK